MLACLAALGSLTGGQQEASVMTSYVFRHCQSGLGAHEGKQQLSLLRTTEAHHCTIVHLKMAQESAEQRGVAVTQRTHLVSCIAVIVQEDS